MAGKKIYGTEPGLIDLTGQRFGNLLVTAYTIYTPPRGCQEYRWQCRCDCGGGIAVKADKLLANKTTKCRVCGIAKWSKANVLPDNKAFINRVLNNYKRAAKTRGHDFLISNEKAVELMANDCYYCGREPQINEGEKRYFKHGEYKRNGIDRKDSSIGYTEGNVVACCPKCNVAKMSLHHDDFLELVHRIYLNQKNAQRLS